MRTLLFVGLIATTAWAQAPETLSGMIYKESIHVIGSNDQVMTVISLREDGSYSTVVKEQLFWLAVFPGGANRVLGEADRGTFHYERTGERTASLRFVSAKGQGDVVRNLEFNSTRTGYFVVSPISGGNFALSAVGEASLLNASARGFASASRAMILGFIVPGPQSRYVLVRALGPTLGQLGVPDAAEDPAFEISGTQFFPPEVAVSGILNDDWEADAYHTLSPGASPPAATVAEFVGAFPLANGSKDAAVVLMFPPGAYTAVIRTKSETPKEVLGEIYVVP